MPTHKFMALSSLALIAYAKQNYPMLDKQISKLQWIGMNNQKISVIDTQEIVYDNEIFIENYLAKN